MTLVTLNEEQSVLMELKEDPDLRAVQSPREADVLNKEPAEVEIKAEPTEFPLILVSRSEEEEPESSLQTVKEEPTDAADGTGSEKHPENEEHCDNSSDTDNSEDWTPAAERCTPKTHPEDNDLLSGAGRRNHVSAGRRQEGGPAKRHICSHCGKKFGAICSLDAHEQIHTGEKPFKCTFCGKCFTEKGPLNYHLKTHTGEKPFHCSVCGKCFVRKYCQDQHMKTHTGEKPYKCSICAKGFIRASSLNTHMNGHLGKRAFKCTVCDKGFAQKQNLNAHMKTHPGNKQFKCSVCEKPFTQWWRLNFHTRTCPQENALSNVPPVTNVSPSGIIYVLT